jgi:lysophospholipase L1-like esterase
MGYADPSPPAQRFPGAKKALAVFLIWVLIISAGLVVCELLVRSTHDLQLFAFPLQKVSPYYSPYDNYSIYNRNYFEERPSYFAGWPVKPELFDAGTPAPRYIFKPNLTLAARGGKLVPAGTGDTVYWSTNSHGLRGDDFPEVKPPGTIRIVCLGASTTEGLVYDNETYPYYLQQELRQRYPDKTIEVINAGHHAYKAEDNLALLEQQILPLKPDLVIWYETANDLNFTEFSPSLQAEPCWREGICWLAGKPWGYEILYQDSALFRLLADRFGGNPVPPSMAHSFDDTGTKRGALRYTDTLRRMAAAAKAANTSLAFVSFVTVADDGLHVNYEESPYLFDQVYRTYYPLTPGEIGKAYAYYNNQSRQVAEENNLPYYDLATEFPQDPEYFPSDYIHFNPEGNRLFARLLAQHLANGTVLSYQ